MTMKSTRQPLDLSAFQGRDTWIFDLDNTLYPRKCDIHSQMDANMTAYVADLLKLSRPEALKVQKEYYKAYGTTLRGLINHHHIDPAHYLEEVHKLDYSIIPPAPELGNAIKALPGRKYVFTNGDTPHAERTLAQLGITNLFDDIFDIVAADLVPKPHEQTYEKFRTHTGIIPDKAAMFEDLHRNLEVPHSWQMATVLIVPESEASHSNYEWENEVPDEEHVHHITDDLTDFLERVLEVL